MRKAVVITVVLFAAAVTQAQYKPRPTPAQQPITVGGAKAQTGTNFQRISMADAYRLYRENKAVFIDVRSETQFRLGHIKGALGIPGSQLIRRFAEVPSHKTIITYCACSAEQSSGRAASDLGAHGVKNVYALKGGWNEWKANRYPALAGPK